MDTYEYTVVLNIEETLSILQYIPCNHKPFHRPTGKKPKFMRIHVVSVSMQKMFSI